MVADGGNARNGWLVHAILINLARRFVSHTPLFSPGRGRSVGGREGAFRGVVLEGVDSRDSGHWAARKEESNGLPNMSGREGGSAGGSSLMHSLMA